MEYPKYLSVGNWLFMHIEKDVFSSKNPVGGAFPENIYCVYPRFEAINLSTDLRTYEGLIEYGCTEPDEEELLRLIK